MSSSLTRITPVEGTCDDARSIWSNWGDAWLCARATEAAGVLGEVELRGVAAQISAEDRYSRSQFDN